MANIWKGAGTWEGWKLTTDHASNSFSQPVLVSPDGTAYGPGDIVSLADVMAGPIAADEWGVGGSTVRNYAAQGKFLPGEIKRLNRDWIVTRQGMKRLFGKPNSKSHAND